MKTHFALPLLTALMLSAGIGAAVAQDTSFEYRLLAKELTVLGEGSGGSTVPGLALSAQSVDFGSVATNTTETRQVLATNSGGGVLSWTAAPAVSGNAAFAAGATACGASLTAGQSCLTDVTFSPTSVGTFNGTLTFVSALANSPHQVSLVGTAFNPVSLASATLPAGTVGQPYTYDFKTLLAVSNETMPDRALATWEGSGSLPAGLALNTATGILSGTPSAAESGASYTVTGTYKNNRGQQVYTIVVNGVYLEVVQLDSGSSHACAVTTAGGVKCWGNDIYGQLGNDTALSNQPTPVDVSGLTSGVASVSAGGSHTCAVTTAGGLKCWGRGSAGQLGNNTTVLAQPTPVDVSGLTSGVASVSAGGSYTCAVTTAGGLKCWGNDIHGQLGNDTALSNWLTPVDVSGLTSGVVSVSAGNSHTCAVTTAGGLKCWGRDESGQLGNDTALSNQPTPVDVSGLTSGVASVSAGTGHTCAVTTAGGVKCWGNDIYGQLGNDTALSNQPTPVDVSGLTSGVASVSAGSYHTCAVTTAGGLKCWGRDDSGQLGNDTALVDQPIPVNVAGLTSGVASVAAGSDHTCAVTTAGGLKCWGADSSGQLGDDTSLTSRATPVDVQR